MEGPIDNSVDASHAPTVEPRPICVVLDTNLWKQATFLRTPLAVSLLFTMTEVQGKIGLPEVLEREVIKHAGMDGQETAVKIKNHLRTLERMYGKRLTMPVAEEAAYYEDLARQRLWELGPQLQRLATTDDQLRRAAERVIQTRPPNKEGKQQFKDSLIWEAVVDLATDFDVSYASLDGDYTGVLDEAGMTGKTIKLYKTIVDVLSALAPSRPAFNSAAVLSVIESVVLPVVDDSMHRVGYGLKCGARRDADLKAFSTDKPNALAIRFQLTYSVEVIADPAEFAVGVVVSGECGYDSDTKTIIAYSLSRIELQQPNEQYPKGVVYLQTISAYSVERSHFITTEIP